MAFYRVLLRQSFRGREMQNVFHLEDPSNLMTQQLIADKVVIDWIPHIRWIQNSQCIYFQIQVSRILVPDPLATYSLDLNILGAVTGSQCVGFEAIKLRFATELAGKHHRGRYFIGGLTTGFISPNAEGLQAAGITQMNTNILQLSDKWCEPNPNTGLNLVIAHKDHSTPTRSSGVGYDTFLTYLRSRKLGIGI